MVQYQRFRIRVLLDMLVVYLYKPLPISPTMGHYYSEEPSTPLKTKTIGVCLRGYCFKFVTASGVFSFGKLDRGTELLIR